MAFDGLVTGADEGFEAGLVAIGSGVVLGDGVLADGKAQEVKADLALIFVEGMGDVGLAWFET